MALHSSLLQQFALLRQLDSAALQGLASVSELRTFARREMVMDKGAQPAYLYFLLEGRIQATDFTLDGKEVCLHFVDEGHYFGEVAILDGLGQPEIMLAHKKSQLVLVPAGHIRPLLLGTPAVAEAMATGLATRVRAQSEQRQILSINNPLQRTCAQILLLLKQARQGQDTRLSSESTVQWPQAPTHQELALMANLSRETVTRVFQVLQSQSALDRQAEGLVVDVDRLRQLASSENP